MHYVLEALVEEGAMSRDIEDHWQELQQRLKEKWSRLTDDDIEGIKGKRPQLENLLKQYYGYNDLEARAELDAWLRQF